MFHQQNSFLFLFFERNNFHISVKIVNILKYFRITGAPGVDGKNGADGKDGAEGPAGETGSQGIYQTKTTVTNHYMFFSL